MLLFLLISFSKCKASEIDLKLDFPSEVEVGDDFTLTLKVTNYVESSKFIVNIAFEDSRIIQSKCSQNFKPQSILVYQNSSNFTTFNAKATRKGETNFKISISSSNLLTKDYVGNIKVKGILMNFSERFEYFFNDKEYQKHEKNLKIRDHLSVEEITIEAEGNLMNNILSKKNQLKYKTYLSLNILK